MRVITRGDVEEYLKSSYATDPVIRAGLEIILQIMDKRHVDRLENNPPVRLSA
jgi:hypothetical protein